MPQLATMANPTPARRDASKFCDDESVPSLRRRRPEADFVGMVTVAKHRLAGSVAYRYRRAMAPSPNGRPLRSAIVHSLLRLTIQPSLAKKPTGVHPARLVAASAPYAAHAAWASHSSQKRSHLMTPVSFSSAFRFSGRQPSPRMLNSKAPPPQHLRLRWHRRKHKTAKANVACHDHAAESGSGSMAREAWVSA